MSALSGSLVAPVTSSTSTSTSVSQLARAGSSGSSTDSSTSTLVGSSPSALAGSSGPSVDSSTSTPMASSPSALANSSGPSVDSSTSTPVGSSPSAVVGSSGPSVDSSTSISVGSSPSAVVSSSSLSNNSSTSTPAASSPSALAGSSDPSVDSSTSTPVGSSPSAVVGSSGPSVDLSTSISVGSSPSAVVSSSSLSTNSSTSTPAASSPSALASSSGPSVDSSTSTPVGSSPSSLASSSGPSVDSSTSTPVGSSPSSQAGSSDPSADSSTQMSFMKILFLESGLPALYFSMVAKAMTMTDNDYLKLRHVLHMAAFIWSVYAFKCGVGRLKVKYHGYLIVSCLNLVVALIGHDQSFTAHVFEAYLQLFAVSVLFWAKQDMVAVMRAIPLVIPLIAFLCGLVMFVVIEIKLEATPSLVLRWVTAWLLLSPSVCLGAIDGRKSEMFRPSNKIAIASLLFDLLYLIILVYYSLKVKERTVASQVLACILLNHMEEAEVLFAYFILPACKVCVKVIDKYRKAFQMLLLALEFTSYILGVFAGDIIKIQKAIVFLSAAGLFSISIPLILSCWIARSFLDVSRVEWITFTFSLTQLLAAIYFKSSNALMGALPMCYAVIEFYKSPNVDDRSSLPVTSGHRRVE